MADALDTNNVPMQGNGGYREHAALQYEAMLRGLPLLQKATMKASSVERPVSGQLFRVIEYGSAHGNNSIKPMETILQSSKRDQVQVLFNDRPENDFSTLSSTIAAWRDTLNKSTFPGSIFSAIIPRNFYQDVVPPQSVDLGFSFACLHHVDHVPKDVYDDPSRIVQNDTLKSQAHIDLARFLRLRGAEIVSGGSLVLSFASQPASGQENYPGLIDSFRGAMIQMIQDGRMPMTVAASFAVPVHYRNMDEVRKVLDEVSGTWAVHEFVENEVLHPAILDLKRLQGEGKHDQASQQYADAVVDWMMGVCSGYCLKALRVGSQNAYTEGETDELMKEWTRRTKELFIRDHRDEVVNCSFIYLRLERV